MLRMPVARRAKRRIAPLRTSRGVVPAALLCGALAFALYVPALSFDFVNWDDWEYVVLNPHLRSLDLEYVRWCLGSYHAGNWHPVTLLSYGLDYAVWERAATGYHLTNVLLHAANSALVVWLVAALFGRVRTGAAGNAFGAAVVGLAFASHPLHVESVAWISERKDVLYGLFWLLSLIAWLAYTDPDADRRRRRFSYSISLAAFTLSALSKPMAVTLPLVLLILDVHPLRRITRRGDLLPIAIVEKLPFLCVALITGVLTLLAQSARGALGKADLSLADRLSVAAQALGFYLIQWALPRSLVPFYPLDPQSDPLAWPHLGWLVVGIVAVGLATVLWRWAPAIWAGLAFYVVTLLPVLGIIEIGYQRAADRYMYLPLLGPTVLVGAAAARMWDGSARTRRIAIAAALLALGLSSWRTIEQLPVWRSSLSLWNHVVAAYPGSPLARYNLGHALAMAGQPARAEAEWKRTLEIDPSYTPALYELGAAAGRRRDYRSARRYFEAVVASDPGNARGRLELAMVLETLGDRAEAARHYREFIRTSPPEYAEQVEFARSRLALQATDDE
jgi:tetratricopeptide (TPR) repeat protein